MGGTSQALPSLSPPSPEASSGQRRHSQLPFVTTTQASTHRSKGGITAASIMYSTSALQDSDLVLASERVEETGALPTDPAILKLSVVLSRSGPKRDTIVEFDWNAGSVKEMTERETGEDEEDDEDAD